ncbi:DUF4153 domain-containing protein [Micromonospora sp. HUAS LYJ1]|uniref:DUF4153 domain-containing protein n=1 Tax=Micromonospora sp. HUAS LYJ1 TaxID=3061626 RepID=UPI002672B716|nr:DUF4173 domain-containing protein [Micromonospora sp. HUAS LYJ1]WKU04331.1 DUF4173 domain-containing protein [Micromonospora sp. HUAS LYJ1]
MSKPEPTSDSPGGRPPPPGPPPVGGMPYLLTVPAREGLPPAIRWPGQEGEPGWAIPVQVPDGTLGYALFLPLVPTTDDTAPGGACPAAAVLPAGPGDDRPTGTATTPPPLTTTGPAAAAEGAPAATTPAAPATADAVAGPTAAEAAPADPTAAGGPAAGGSSRPAGVPAPRTAAASADHAPTPTGQPTPLPAAAPATPGPQFGPGRPVPAGQQPPPAPGRPGPAGFGAGGRPAQWGAAPASWAPTPTPPSFLSTRWPGPRPATGWAVPAAVLAGALGVAFFVPLTRTGIGWFLGWLVLTVGVVAAVRRNADALNRTDRLIRGGWAVAALALLAVPAFRNAWWLVTFCVLGALGCATLAIVGGRQVRSILFSLVAAPLAALRGLPWVRRHVTATDGGQLVPRVVGSVVATAVVVLVFGLLLSSADAAFDQVLGAVVPEVNVGTVVRWLFLAAVGGSIAVAATYTLAAPPDLSTVDREGRRRLGMLEWAPAIAALTLLFVGFVAVQFTVLFGGQRHVLRTAGLSYAEYARSGFWQLTVVTLLTVAVLGGVSRWARRETRAERVLLRALLGLLSALSVVIVVSALSRMYTYQKVYSFTGERIFVMAFELLLGAVFLMILAAGVRWRGRWIPGATVGLAVVMLLSLAVLNPEDYAARRNIARYEQSGKIDAWYLRALSADATPALADLPDPIRRCALSWIDDDLAEPDPWYAWNLGRSRARAELKRLGPRAGGGRKDCLAADQFDLPKTRRTPR